MNHTYNLQHFEGRTGYHIFVDRFLRGGDELSPIKGRIIKQWEDSIPNWWPDEDGVFRNEYFYGGDLKGIIKSLDDIKSMGFNLIYLSPISHTHTYHHYDVENQLEIDPYIGNWDDFKMLCQEAHSKDILICVDLVFNHMGIRSEFFQKALAGNEQYKKWFEWNHQGNPVYWYGFRDMPQCNKLDKDYQEYACDVIEKYISMGADGIRLDLGEILPKEFMMTILKKAKTINPSVIFINERWEFATSSTKPYLYIDMADTVMNYPRADAIIRWVRYGNSSHFQYTEERISKYPYHVQNLLWNLLDSHDTPRALTMLVGDKMNENPYNGRVWDIESPWRSNYGFDTYHFREWEYEHDKINVTYAQEKLKLASLIQYIIRGIPMVFSGTEVGVCGYKDPFNRKPYPWKQRNEELKKHYTQLGILRNSNQDILKNGEMFIEVQSDIMSIHRNFEYKRLTAILNRTCQSKKISVPAAKIVFSLNESSEKELNPFGAIVYYEK